MVLTINAAQRPTAEGSRWRRRLAIIAALGVAAGLSGGIAASTAAAPLAGTTNASFVTLATPFKMFSSKAFAANASFNGLVLGGATKVPTDATTVYVLVTVGGAVAGSMTFYPTGDPSGTSGQSLFWTAGGTTTGTIEENVGLSDDVTFSNGGAAAKASASITGYSGQVTAGDVNGSGGSSGQVLTDTGTGAQWQSLGNGYRDYVSSNSNALDTNGEDVASLNLPAGVYYTSWTGTAASEENVLDTIQCALVSPTGNHIDFVRSDIDVNPIYTSVSLSGMVSTIAAGSISVSCSATDLSIIQDSSLNAIRLSSAQGNISN